MSKCCEIFLGKEKGISPFWMDGELNLKIVCEERV